MGYALLLVTRQKNATTIFFFWDKGSKNEVDYFTKHFPALYHRVKRSRYVQDKLNIIRDTKTNGCAISFTGDTKTNGCATKSEQKNKLFLKQRYSFAPAHEEYVEKSTTIFFPKYQKEKYVRKSEGKSYKTNKWLYNENNLLSNKSYKQANFFPKDRRKNMPKMLTGNILPSFPTPSVL